MTTEPSERAAWHRSRRLAWVAATALVLLAAALKARCLEGLDHACLEQLQALRTIRLDGLVRAITFFGSAPWTMALAAVMGGWWFWTRQRVLLKRFIWAWGLALAVQVILRLWVAQWRPDAPSTPEAMSLVQRFNYAGFPSGHAFRSAFLYGWWSRALLYRRLRWTALAAWGVALLILAVGLTRVYLARHWLTDVLGAWLLAAAALSCVPAQGDRRT